MRGKAAASSIEHSPYPFYMKNFVFFCLLAFGAVLSHAQVTFSLDELMSTPFTSNLVVESGGNRLAWVSNVNGRRNIWVTEKAGAKPVMATNFQEDDGQELSDLILVPNTSNLIFVRGGATNSKGEIPMPISHPDWAKQEIWLQDLSKSSEPARKLAQGAAPSLHPDGKTLVFLRRGQVFHLELSSGTEKQLFQIRGSAGQLRWSPDGKHLAFVSNREDHSFIGVFNLQTRDLRYLTPSVDLDNNPVWSPDGKKIAFIRQAHESGFYLFLSRRTGLPWSIWTADLASGQAVQVWKASPGYGSAFQGFFSAPNQVFWTSSQYLVFPWESDGWVHLYGLPANGGSARLLTPGKGEVQYANLSADKSKVIFSCNINDIDRAHIWQADPVTGQSQQLSQGMGIEWQPVACADGTVAFLAAGSKVSGFAAQIVSGAVKPLLSESLAPNFPMTKLVEPQAVTFTATDGMQIPGQLFLPPNLKSGEKRPALVFFHGGSRRQMLLGYHNLEYYHHTYAFNQYMANQGYVVLAVNFRSGIGYGLEFREALNFGAGGCSEFNDVLGANFFLRNHPNVEAKKIGIWGGSYGGYLTAMGLSRASDLYAAGVDIHGVHDWNKVIKNFNPAYNPLADPEMARKAYESSPMHFLSGWRSPVLIIHGDDDRNVPFAESVDLVESLRKQGNVEFEQLIFPDEVHGFLLHRNWKEAFKRTADFFKRKL